MQPLLRWKKILPFRTMGAGPGPASISGQLRQLLFAAGLLLALLIIAQLGALTVNRMISTRLVEQRIIPMGQLQTINSAYQTSWAIADKVQTGTIDKAGGVTALHDIRTALGEDWRELESGTPDSAAQFAENRIDADRAVVRRETDRKGGGGGKGMSGR